MQFEKLSNDKLKELIIALYNECDRVEKIQQHIVEMTHDAELEAYKRFGYDCEKIYDEYLRRKGQ